jgi:hypothetical protein
VKERNNELEETVNASFVWFDSFKNQAHSVKIKG